MFLHKQRQLQNRNDYEQSRQNKFLKKNMNIYDKKIFDKIYEVHSEGVMKASKSEKRN